MSKATEARVRDELLQNLYSSVLRCTLAASGVAGGAENPAVAAGVCANLEFSDALLLPAQHAGSFRVLRGLARHPTAGGIHRDRKARVYGLPEDEAQAIAFALAMGLAAADAGNKAVVGVVLPARAVLAPAHGKPRRLPQTWTDAGTYAARLGLPLLFVSAHKTTKRRLSGASDPKQPAALYPSIPVDCEDALAIYRVAFECAARAREGGGPSHVIAGRYDGDSGTALVRLEAMLRRRGCYTKAWQRKVEREIVADLAGFDSTRAMD